MQETLPTSGSAPTHALVRRAARVGCAGGVCSSVHRPSDTKDAPNPTHNECRPCAHATHAHPARRHRGSRNMQARRASGARSACHGWSAAGLARICALSSRSSRHQPSDPHKATLQACCRAACDAFDAPSIAAPPSAAPSLFELEPTRAASSRTTCGPLNPGGCSPVARGVRWRPPIRLHRMSDEVTRRTMR